MTLSIANTLSRAFRRTFERNGIVFIFLFTVVSVLSYFLAPVPVVQPDGTVEQVTPLGIPPSIGASLAVALYVPSAMIHMATIRTFVSGTTDRIPAEHFTRNFPLVLINLIAGVVVFYGGVLIGLVVLVIPGLFLLVSLWFWTVYVILEDQNFITAFRSSWALTRGGRWRLFAIGISAFLFYAILAIFFQVLSFGTGIALFTPVGAAIGLVFIHAVTAEAYVVLRNRDADDAPVYANQSVTEQLAQLHQSGVLTDEEYEAKLAEIANTESERERQLTLLREARDMGLISAEEFEQKRQQLAERNPAGSRG